jgi:general stress protein 26
MSAHLTSEQHVEKLAELLDGIPVAMLSTVCPDGTLRSRPMAAQRTPFDGALWFFTQANAPKVGKVEWREQVNLSYVAPDRQRSVCVSGTAHLVRDRGKVEELWQPSLKAWFPEGLDDPGLALLRVDVETAEYWDSPSATSVVLDGFARAPAAGQPHRPGESRKLGIEKMGSLS